MTVLLISSYIACIHVCTAAFIVHNVYRYINGRRRGTREESRKQVLDSPWSVEMIKLTRDGTAEPVSRDQIPRRERGQGIIHFHCSAS